MSKLTVSKKKSIYSPHPSLEYARNVIAKMEKNTGRRLDDWVELARAKGPKTDEKRREWLRKTHGLGTNHAGWISERSFGKGEELIDEARYLEQAEQYVEDLFSGARAGLRPIYDELLAVVFALGRDIRVSPCQTFVPVFRKFAIAQIKPSTRTRVDLGLALGRFGGKLPKRLIDTGGAAKKDRITHRIELSSREQVEGDAVKWLETAYELDGEK